MQYIVQTKGAVTVVDERVEAYVIDARSQEEAYDLARARFQETYGETVDGLKGKAVPRTFRAILAMILLVIPIVISFLEWQKESSEGFWIFAKQTVETVNFHPNLLSTLLAVIFFSAFILRYKGLERLMASKLDVALTAVVILFIATLFELILKEQSIKLFGFIPLGDIKPIYLLVTAIIMSWFGVRGVSSVMMAIVFFLSIGRLSELQGLMPVWVSLVFVLSAFFGLVLYCLVEPAFYDSLPQLQGHLQSGMVYLKADAAHTRAAVTQASRFVSSAMPAGKALGSLKAKKPLKLKR